MVRYSFVKGTLFYSLFNSMVKMFDKANGFSFLLSSFTLQYLDGLLEFALAAGWQALAGARMKVSDTFIIQAGGFLRTTIFWLPKKVFKHIVKA